MKKVNILLSSFNGEKYIGEQIDSIMNQSGVDILLTIRDDGSTDGTLEVIKNKKRVYRDKISIIEGENIGYRKSFLQLLRYASDADYYGFSDQDDVWMRDKCEAGVRKLGNIHNNIALYATGVILTDEDLNIIGKTDSWNMPLTVESYFTRQRLAGCTYLFSKGLKQLAERFVDVDLPDEQMPDHDFVVGSCAFACGDVYLDQESYIYHRRHEKSVTSGGMGVVKRVKVEYDLVFKRKRVQSTMAELLLTRCADRLNKKTISCLTEIANSKTSLINKIRLVRNRDMKTGIFICDIETKFKILIGNY